MFIKMFLYAAICVGQYALSHIVHCFHFLQFRNFFVQPSYEHCAPGFIWQTLFSHAGDKNKELTRGNPRSGEWSKQALSCELLF